MYTETMAVSNNKRPMDPSTIQHQQSMVSRHEQIAVDGEEDILVSAVE